MVDTTNSDILMYFVRKPGGEALAAESTSELTTGDSFTSDFSAGKYFQADTFSFSLKLSDDESVGAVGGDGRSYARWRTLIKDIKPKPPYLAEPDDFSITRLIDSASPILLRHCLKTHPFEKAVLVKRARSAAGVLTGFFRMEFEKVWIKAIEWDDGEAVKETCKFKYVGLKVTYRKRKPDGSTASSWPCKWSGKINA